MRVIGLDMATRTGWAYIDTDSPHRLSGHRDFGRPGTPLPDRLLNFRGYLIDMILSKAPHIIVYEVAHHRGGPATRSGIGMETVLLMEARKMEVTTHGLHSASLKKWATGNGRASKDDMVAIASERDGFSVITNDDEADAVHLARWGVAHVELDVMGRPSIKLKHVSKRKRGTK